ncbi:MAG TPA: YSC84-related protein [Burkholderiales bacterium]
MKLHRILMTGVLMVSFVSGGAVAADKAAQQAEIRKVTAASLEKFYKAKPELKEQVAKAPGYAVFTTYGLSFLVGGGGGKGLVHDQKTGKDTFMSMAQGSAGAQIGIAESETLFVFDSEKSMTYFVDKGWEGGGGGAAQAGMKGKSVGEAGGGGPGGGYYTLTKNGLQAGVAVQGTKFWKDKDLN